MSNTLPPFPVDEVTLSNVRHSLSASFGEDHEIVGAEFSLHRLLDFMSGFDESKVEYEDGSEGVACYPHPTYTYHDVIRAMLDEILRLRDYGASSDPVIS